MTSQHSTHHQTSEPAKLPKRAGSLPTLPRACLLGAFNNRLVAFAVVETIPQLMRKAVLFRQQGFSLQFTTVQKARQLWLTEQNS